MSLLNPDEANYQNGLIAFKNNDFPKGIEFFITAAKNDYKPALKELGICYLYGIYFNQNLKKAVIYFNRSKTEPEAQFELSRLFYFGHGVKKDLDIARKLLIASARSGYGKSLILMAVCYQMSQQFDKALVLFNHAFENGDIFASHLMRNDYITDCDCSYWRDVAASFNWPEASPCPVTRSFHQKPDIYEISGMLTDIECEYIKYIASPFMRESMIVDPQSGEYIRDPVRTSYSATIYWLSEDPAINLIMEKLCRSFSVSGNQSEILHVLHYNIGEEYKPHYDFFGGMDNHENFDKQDQRIKTICVYLNDVQQGGETEFPRLKINVTPEKGKAIFFENIDSDNHKPYIESLHAGKPVISGEKWLATLWIRENNTNRGPDYE